MFWQVLDTRSTSYKNDAHLSLDIFIISHWCGSINIINHARRSPYVRTHHHLWSSISDTSLLSIAGSPRPRWLMMTYIRQTRPSLGISRYTTHWLLLSIISLSFIIPLTTIVDWQGKPITTRLWRIIIDVHDRRLQKSTNGEQREWNT